MPYIAEAQNVGGLGKAETRSEINEEMRKLESIVQQVFDSTHALTTRLQPFLRQQLRSSEVMTDNIKSPEPMMSDFGSALAQRRKALEEINGTLIDVLTRLAI